MRRHLDEYKGKNILITGNQSGVEFVPRRDRDKITRRRASIAKETELRYRAIPNL